MLVIENVSLKKAPQRHGLTDVLFKMKIGQSVYVATNYYAAHSCINSAKRRRKKEKLKGVFLVVPEGNGVRVGRTA